MGEDNDDADVSTSDDSDVADLFKKADAVVKAGMAESSSDEDDNKNKNGAGIQLYATGNGTDNGEADDAKIRRAARERKRRAAAKKFNTDSDDDDDDKDSFVPKSQTKNSTTGRPAANQQVVSLLDDSNMDSSDEEMSSPQDSNVAGSAAGINGVLNAETTRQLRELRCAKRTNDATTTTTLKQQPKSPLDVDDDDDPMQSSRNRWITVNIEGTKESANFTLEESNSIKDVIAMCVEKFKMDPGTPIGLYHEKRLLHYSDLLFDVPVQCTLIAKVHNFHLKAVKEAPKGTIMRLTLRGPNGDMVVEIGSLQPLKVALDQYGIGRSLKFDGDVLQLGLPPGDNDLEDEDLVDVVV